MPDRELTFRAVAEPQPGPNWQARFEPAWPSYRNWYLRDGDAARPSFVTARAKLSEHLPQLVPAWERLVELAGGGDLSARMLTMYDTPPLVRGCSQAALSGDEPALVRNYDFHPDEFEAVIWESELTGRRVIGMSDCLWGLLDGINDAGLAVSLAFGGAPDVAPGFAIPIVVRHLLETCESTRQAIATLASIPIQMAYNLTILDAAGDARTVFTAPGRAPRTRALAIATNHQEEVRWPEHARAVRSVERERRLRELLAKPSIDAGDMIAAFLSAPLYSTAYKNWFGTLYTAVYRPTRPSVDYIWPQMTWPQSFDEFDQGERAVRLGHDPDAPVRMLAGRAAAPTRALPEPTSSRACAQSPRRSTASPPNA